MHFIAQTVQLYTRLVCESESHIRGMSEKKQEKGHNSKSFDQINLKLTQIEVHSFTTSQRNPRGDHFCQRDSSELIPTRKKSTSRLSNQFLNSLMRSSSVSKAMPPKWRFKGPNK
ncbi:hypothetical protein PoB_006568700 [Plakobranchus ocellatus]|uniref:Uncharacterized protein n=1 Tax=Plakobranchus ocellatus TaxID=259542 RepID=A0AAV4D4M9_9GAST|nr:hypothetical protein PoB_006568700 [Plakobranchus ocellatus]